MSFYSIFGLFQTAGVRGGAVLGDLVRGALRGAGGAGHHVQLHRPPQHPRQDHPPHHLRPRQRPQRPRHDQVTHYIDLDQSILTSTSLLTKTPECEDFAVIRL